MKKALILLLFLSLVRLLVSCCGSKDFSFRWTKLKAQNISFRSNGFVSLLADSAQANEFGLRCSFEHEIVAVSKSQLGIQSSYAWSCPDGFSKNTDTIVRLSIITRNDFDATHPAGSALDDLPIAKQGLFLNDTTYNPLRRLADVLPDLNGRNGSSSPYGELVISFFKVQPRLGNHRFVLRMRLASGRTFEDSASIRLY